MERKERLISNNRKKIDVLAHHAKSIKDMLDKLPDLSDPTITDAIYKGSHNRFFGDYRSNPEIQKRTIKAEKQITSALIRGKANIIPDDRIYLGGLIKVENVDPICNTCLYRRKSPKIIFNNNGALINISRCGINDK